MRLETFILALKGWCITTSAISSALAAGLSQLPTTITEIAHIPIPVFSLLLNAYSAGMVACLGFVSSSFGDYMNKRQGSGNTDFFLKQQQQQQPKTP